LAVSDSCSPPAHIRSPIPRHIFLRAAILITSLETRLQFEAIDVPGNPCLLGPTPAANPAPCVRALGTNSTWNSLVELSTLRLYFSLSMQINRDTNGPMPSISLKGIKTLVNVQALAYCAGPSCYSNSTPVSNASLIEEFYITKEFDMACALNQPACDPVALLDERDYLYDIDHEHRQFNVSVTFFEFIPMRSARAASTVFTFTVHSQV
jgi:hypothetical protein